MEMKLPNRLALEADTGHVLMSDALKDQLDHDDEEAIDDMFVSVIADRRIGDRNAPMAGTLRSVLFESVNPEIDIRLQIDDAFDTINAQTLTFGGFDMLHGDKKLTLAGPFTVKAARIDEVDVPRQLCVLSLQLQRVQKRQ